MSFNRYTDRIESSANTYNNPYRQDRDSARAYQVLHARRPDTIESSQVRLERSLMQQFQSNQFRLPSQRLLIIAQVGRFIILAITLPPYIFFYGAPKWMLEQIKPLLVKMMDGTGTVLEKLMNATSAWSTDVFGFITQRAKQAFQRKAPKKKSKREGDNLFQMLAKDLKAKIADWKAAYAKVKHHAGNLQAKIQKRLAEATKASAANLMHKVQRAVKVFATPLLAMQKYLKKTFLSNTSNGEKVAVQSNIVRLQSAVKNGVKATMRKLVKTAERAGKALTYAAVQVKTAFATTIVQPVVAFVAPVAVFTKNYVVPAAKAALNIAVIKPLTIARAVVESSLVFIRERVQMVAIPIIHYGMKLAERSLNAVQKSLNVFILYQRAFVDHMRRVSRTLTSMAQPFKRAFQRISSDLKEQSKRFYQRAKEKAVKAAAISKAAMQLAVAKSKQLPGMMWRAIKYLFKGLYLATKKTLWGIRVGLTWTKILVRYSYQTLIRI